MFAKDVEFLNKLYNESINLGPLGDQDPSAGLSPSKLQQIKMPVKRKCMKCISDEECEQPDFDNNNADMSKQSLFRIYKLSAMLHDLICKEEQVEPWVLAKITEALQHLEAVFGFKDYEDFKSQFEHNIHADEMSSEEGLYESTTNSIENIKMKLSFASKESLEQLLYEAIKVLETKK